MIKIHRDGPENARAIVVLAHGAGAPMDSPFMDAFAALLGERGLAVARFEFAYMAGRRTGGSKRPPPRAEKLVDEFDAALEAIEFRGPMIIGGKSLGGRVASLTASRAGSSSKYSGVLCLGFPFHPSKRPEKLRLNALVDVIVPILICQGTRDPFGNVDEVMAYELPKQTRFFWAPDGDHDLVPRKATGRSAKDNWIAAADAISTWSKIICA